MSKWVWEDGGMKVKYEARDWKSEQGGLSAAIASCLVDFVVAMLLRVTPPALRAPGGMGTLEKVKSAKRTQLLKVYKLLMLCYISAILMGKNEPN